MNTTGNIPQFASQMVDKNGQITPPWLAFFTNLFKRTGGSINGVLADPGNNGIVTRTAANVTAAGQLSGDVTTTGSSLATTIAPHAITYSKIQNEGATSLLGNPTGSPASPSEITLGAGLSFSGTTLISTGSGGTVITTGSPATGNLTKFSGATSITNGDLSGDVGTSGSLATTIGTNKVSYAKFQQANSATLIGNPTGSAANVSEITLGSQLSFTGSILNTAGITATITTAALTTLGSQGSMTFTNGILTAHTDAT